jgi:hypothetical protein
MNHKLEGWSGFTWDVILTMAKWHRAAWLEGRDREARDTASSLRSFADLAVDPNTWARPLTPAAGEDPRS